jgi:predicted amidophosphoribosyltransferase
MSDHGSIAGDINNDFAIGFGGYGESNLMCPSCYGTNFKHLESSIVCKDCGAEVSHHGINATLEYKDYN